MSDDAKAADARRELEAQLPPNLDVDFDEVFPKLTGWGLAKANTVRAQLLGRVAPVLERCLADGDQIRFLTMGIVNFNVEVFFMGLWAQLINRSVIVVTRSRLLLIHCDSKGNPKSYVNDLPIESVKNVSRSLFGSTMIYAGKGSRIFSGIKRAEAKILASMFQKNKAATGTFRFLCPGCFASHAKHVEKCPSCHTETKSKMTAALRSLFLPGLGDWYLGHKVLAGFEMFGSAVLWIIVLATLVGVATGEAGIIELAVILVVLAIAHCFDAALTHFQASKGMMSVDGRLPTAAAVPGGAPAPAPIVPS